MDLNGKESNFATETGYLGQAQQILDYNMVANHFGEKTMSYINSDGALRGQSHKVSAEPLISNVVPPAQKDRKRKAYFCWVMWKIRPFR